MSTISAPQCFISALALSVLLGGGIAVAQPSGCRKNGSDLTCTGNVSNPDAFNPRSSFDVKIGTPQSSAHITQNHGDAGIEVNAGDESGTITMTAGSTISASGWHDSSRSGLLLTSDARWRGKTYTLNIDGTISTDAERGDAVRLEGTSAATFKVTIGEHGHIGGGGGDDGIVVTDARSLLLNNYGIVEGGTGQLNSGGEGVRVGSEHDRTAGNGVTINNYGTIDGTGNHRADGGQGIAVFGDGDVTVMNAAGGEIAGARQGILVEAHGVVSITNDGHIQGNYGSGVEIADAERASVTNSSRHTISGATDGLYIHDVDDAQVDNDHGRIVGHDGDGVKIRDVEHSVTVTNRFGSQWHAASIEGSDNGLSIEDVGRNVSVDNRFGGKITGRSDDGVAVRDVDGRVGIDNAFGGSVSGHDDGLHINDVRRDVTIDNSFGGRITGLRDDGIDVGDARDDVRISNNFGGRIAGRDNGIQIRDVRDDVSISNNFGGSITGRNGAGIDITRVGDDVTISNVAGQISGSDGVNVSRVEDNVTIANAFGAIYGRSDDGVHADDIDGEISVDNAKRGRIAGRDDGIHVSDVSDDVSIDNKFDGRVSGWYGDGIDVSDVRDDVRISNDFGGAIFGGDNGVQIRDVWEDVTISNNFGGRIAGRDGSGVDVSHVRDDVKIENILGSISGGDDGVHVERAGGDVALRNWAGAITGEGDGVHIRHVEDDVEISNGFGGSITGEHDDGIDIRDVDDDVRVDNRFGGRISGRDDGVKIEHVGDDVAIKNSFGGSISGARGDGIAVEDVGDDVTIDNRFGGKIRSSRGDGISIRDVEQDVHIVNQNGSVRGEDDGVHIRRVDGDVTIDNDGGTIRGRRDAGVDIHADGKVTIDNGSGEIRGRSNAIAVAAGEAEINSSGLIRGSGLSDPVIKLSTDLGATINNEAGGVIRGFRSAPSAKAIEADGGAVTINNDGTIIGRVDLSAAGNTGQPNTFNNTSNNSWHVVGLSQLGNGLADTFNNTGTIYTTDPEDAATGNVTELAGVENFNNGGSAGPGTINLQDGYTGDVFTLSPTPGGTLAFNGAPGQSVLKVDSFLGTVPGSTSDTLVIDGSVTGVTAIQVNNLNQGFGSFNPTGVNVVTTTGTLPANSFYLQGGPIKTGMFDYDLYLNGANNWVLASAPNNTFFELPSLTTAAQSIWHNASGAWLDRTADLRTALESTCDVGSLKDASLPCAKPASGVWAKILGSSESRSNDHSFSVLNTAQRHTVNTQLDGGGVIGGYDIIRKSENLPGIWMVGVMGGYLRSSLGFDRSATDAEFEGGAVGAYVTYLSGGWFVDGQILSNIGNVRYSGDFSQKDHANVTSVGGVIDTGYRMAYGAAFIEPGATLSYVNADIGDLALYGTSVNFTDGDSLRGRVGVRLGTSVFMQQAKFEPFVGASFVYEFLGDNTADVSSGGYVLKATDNLTGAIGEVSGGINVFSLTGNGLSAFAKGGAQFGKDDLVGYGGTLGVRVNW